MPRKKKVTEEVDIHERIVLTSELGAVIGKTAQWIRQLTRDGVLKQIERGKYILGESVQAYIDHVTANAKEDNSRAKYSVEKAEHERLKKEKALLELEKMRGELYSAKEVDALFSDMILTVRAKLLAIPSRVAPMLEGDNVGNIERTLKREIEDILTTLSDYEPGAGDKG